MRNCARRQVHKKTSKKEKQSTYAVSTRRTKGAGFTWGTGCTQRGSKTPDGNSVHELSKIEQKYVGFNTFQIMSNTKCKSKPTFPSSAVASPSLSSAARVNFSLADESFVGLRGSARLPGLTGAALSCKNCVEIR